MITINISPINKLEGDRIVQILRSLLESEPDIIQFSIHSKGGEVDAAMEIVDIIDALKAKHFQIETMVKKNCDCRSVACLILAKGDKIFVHPSATFLLHCVQYRVSKEKVYMADREIGSKFLSLCLYSFAQGYYFRDNDRYKKCLEDLSRYYY